MEAMRLATRRVHLSDTDATGVAYAGRLADIALQRLEEGLAACGLEIAELAGGPAGPAVVHLAVDYLRPARLGEGLPAEITCLEVGESSARFSVALGAATANIVLVWVDRTAGRSAPWPAAQRRRLTSLLRASARRRPATPSASRAPRR
jgi:acyl-CoA thioesterase FadM